MRLKPESNIDKEALLPEGIEFRADLLWSKIEEKQNPRKMKPVLWWVATACAVLAIGYIFYPSLEKAPSDQSLISKAVEPNEEPVEEESVSVEVELPVEIILKEVKQENFTSIGKASIVVTLDSISDFGTIENQKADIPLIAITPVEKVPDEPSLSPAALRMRERLQQLTLNKLVEQVTVGEKFNLFKELQNIPTQANSNESSSPVLKGLLRNNDENN